MFESFEFVLVQKRRTIEISKSVFDFDKLFFLHDEKFMQNELTYNTNISQKFRQKRRRRNKNDEKASIRRRQVEKNVNVIEKLIQLQKKKLRLNKKLNC